MLTLRLVAASVLYFSVIKADECSDICRRIPGACSDKGSYCKNNMVCMDLFWCADNIICNHATSTTRPPRALTCAEARDIVAHYNPQIVAARTSTSTGRSTAATQVSATTSVSTAAAPISTTTSVSTVACQPRRALAADHSARVPTRPGESVSENGRRETPSFVDELFDNYFSKPKLPEHFRSGVDRLGALNTCRGCGCVGTVGYPLDNNREIISLAVPQSTGEVDMVDMMKRHFSSSHVVDRPCRACRVERVSNRPSILSAPKMVIVQLNRFQIGDPDNRITTSVRIPTRFNWDQIFPDSPIHTEFILVAVVRHAPPPTLLMDCLDPEDFSWFKDMNGYITPIAGPTVSGPEPSLLVYLRRFTGASQPVRDSTADRIRQRSRFSENGRRPLPWSLVGDYFDDIISKPWDTDNFILKLIRFRRMRSCHHCGSIGTEGFPSDYKEEIIRLVVPQSTGEVDMVDMMRNLFSPSDVVGTHCRSCRVQRERRRPHILSAPNILVVQLNRFYRDEPENRITTSVRIPERFRLEQVLPDRDVMANYRLAAVVRDAPPRTFIADFFDPTNLSWFNVNHPIITPISGPTVSGPEPSLLLFLRI